VCARAWSGRRAGCVQLQEQSHWAGWGAVCMPQCIWEGFRFLTLLMGTWAGAGEVAVCVLHTAQRCMSACSSVLVHQCVEQRATSSVGVAACYFISAWSSMWVHQCAFGCLSARLRVRKCPVRESAGMHALQQAFLSSLACCVSCTSMRRRGRGVRPSKCIHSRSRQGSLTCASTQARPPPQRPLPPRAAQTRTAPSGAACAAQTAHAPACGSQRSTARSSLRRAPCLSGSSSRRTGCARCCHAC